MEIIRVLEILSLANISLQLATAPDDVVVVVLVIGIDSEASNAVLHPGDRNQKKYPLRGPLLRVHTYIYAYVGTCIRGASIRVYIGEDARGSPRESPKQRQWSQPVARRKNTTSDAEQKRSLFNASTGQKSDAKRILFSVDRDRPHPSAPPGCRNHLFFRYASSEILNKNRKGLRITRKSPVVSTVRLNSPL